MRGGDAIKPSTMRRREDAKDAETVGEGEGELDKDRDWLDHLTSSGSGSGSGDSTPPSLQHRQQQQHGMESSSSSSPAAAAAAAAAAQSFLVMQDDADNDAQEASLQAQGAPQQQVRRMGQAINGEETLRTRNHQYQQYQQQVKVDHPVVPTVFDVFAEMRAQSHHHLHDQSALARREETELLEAAAANVEVPSPPLLYNKPAAPSHQRVVSWGLNNSIVWNSSSNNIATTTGGAPPPKRSPLQDRQTSTGSRVSSLGVPDFSSSNSDNYTTTAAAAAAAAASVPASVSSSHFRPPLHSSSNRGTSTATTGSTGRGLGGGGRFQKVLSSVNLEDLTSYNPIEAEAETYIIRSLEHREPSLRLMHSSAPPAVMAHVPDEAASAMATALGGGSGGSGSGIGGSRGDDGGGQEESPLLASSASQERTTASDKEPPRHLSSTTNASSSSPNLPRPPALNRNDRNTTIGTTGTNTHRPRVAHHHRNLTMEQKLFGLASAIDAVRTQESRENHHYSPGTTTTVADAAAEVAGSINNNNNRGRSNTLESFPEDSNEMILSDEDRNQQHPEPISSVDTFQKNASLLYRRINKNTSKDSEKSGGGGGCSFSDGHLEFEDYSNHTRDSHASSMASSSHKQPAHVRWQKLQKTYLKQTSPLRPKKSDDDYAVVLEDANEDVTDSQMRHRPDAGEVGIVFGEGDGDDERSSEAKKTPDASTGGQGGGTHNADNDGRSFPRPSLMIDEWKFARDFKDFLKPWKRSIHLFLKISFFCIITATGIAAILFYLAGNPPNGILINGGHPVNNTLVNENGQVVDPNVASVSWWLLFVVRQIITFALAMVMELVMIDFLSIHSGVTFTLLGAWPTLFILQSRGWPFILFFWGIFDFALLYGTAPFGAHWLFWQTTIGLFNETNSSGHVVDSQWNHRVLVIAVCVASATFVKRFFMGLNFGKKTFTVFSDKLATIMKKILLLSQVASLARDVERDARPRATGSHRNKSTLTSVLTQERLGDLFQNADEDSTCSHSVAEAGRSGLSPGFNAVDISPVIDPDDRHPLTGALSASQKTRIVQLLGAWEEPTIVADTNETVSVNALLQFRRALTCLNTDFPFSVSFGPAGTREDAIESSQNVFSRLLSGSEDESLLNFEVMAVLGVLPDGSLDHDKLISLIKLFRPNRDGTLSMIDFVKSTDSVYREIRLLRAAVNNSSKIDSAFENLFNIVFYGIMLVIILSQLGFDPLAMFVSISGIILAFVFMIGPASSKYFEGILFILVRRPYDVGDGIHVSGVDNETVGTGSGWWLVEDVTLFTTSVMYSFTNERATLANGSLASSRIINSTRSPHACVMNRIKLPIDVSYEKLQLFNEAVAQFVHNRPREWRALCSIRAINIEIAQGFVEYSIVLEHRESWRSWAALRNSQAALATFTIELCKKLDIFYTNPPLPVNLAFVNGPPGESFGGALGPIATPPLGSAMNNLTTPGGNLDYSPDLRSLQGKFAP